MSLGKENRQALLRKLGAWVWGEKERQNGRDGELKVQDARDGERIKTENKEIDTLIVRATIGLAKTWHFPEIQKDIPS